jgi:hypothetical protein
MAMSGIAFVGAFFILVVLGAVALVVFTVRNQSVPARDFPAWARPHRILDVLRPERSVLTSTSAHETCSAAEALRPSSTGL